MKILLLVLLAWSAAFSQQVAQKEEMQAGIAAFRQGKYADALGHFQRAVDADPRGVTPRLYLATAYMAQYIPGADAPENQRFAQQALDNFQRVLAIEPNNETAMFSIASLYYNQKRWDDAVDWNRKLLEVDAENKEAWYTIGVIACTRFMTADREARVQSGMRPDDPGPLKDAAVRAQISKKYMGSLDEGVAAIRQALEIDPEYDDAMAYMNLLIRYRADLLNTREEYMAQSELADGWVEKAMAMKKKKSGGR